MGRSTATFAQPAAAKAPAASARPGLGPTSPDARAAAVNVIAQSILPLRAQHQRQCDETARLVARARAPGLGRAAAADLMKQALAAGARAKATAAEITNREAALERHRQSVLRLETIAAEQALAQVSAAGDLVAAARSGAKTLRASAADEARAADALADLDDARRDLADAAAIGSAAADGGAAERAAAAAALESAFNALALDYAAPLPVEPAVSAPPVRAAVASPAAPAAPARPARSAFAVPATPPV